jgi:hypothetical protein
LRHPLLDLGTLGTALLLHGEHARNGVDQIAVGLFQGLDVDDAALRLLFDFDGLGLHHLGGLAHHLVGRIGDRLLQLHRGFLPAEPEQQDHLLLPHGNGELGGLPPHGFQADVLGQAVRRLHWGGVGAQPLIVGYENQLVEWVLQDSERWKQVEANAPAKPVILYPQPTVFSAHPLISIDRQADDLIDALMSETVLEMAWEDHGFRGPLGTIGKARNALSESRLIDRIDAVLPMPDAPVMLALLDRLAA